VWRDKVSALIPGGSWYRFAIAEKFASDRDPGSCLSGSRSRRKSEVVRCRCLPARARLRVCPGQSWARLDLAQARRPAMRQDVGLEYARGNPMKRRISCCTTRQVVTRVVWAAALGCALSAPLALAQAGAEPMPGNYRIVDGRVDSGTYAGWRIFHSACSACHGMGGAGSAIAPDLTARIGNMTPRAFAAKVLASYRIVAPADGPPVDNGAATPDTMLEQIMRRERGTGGRVSMPAWEGDAMVDPHVLDLYAYLSARADGRIGVGEPRRMIGVKR